jgi:hypothetical protein
VLPNYCDGWDPFPDQDTYDDIIMPELQLEFGWVASTKSFLKDNIAAVFGSETNTLVSQVAGNIYSTIAPPTKTTTTPGSTSPISILRF